MDSAFTPIFGAFETNLTSQQRGEYYAEMLQLSYPAIKAGSPGSWVLTGGIAEHVEFPQGIYTGGGKDFFDFMCIHSHGEPMYGAFSTRGTQVHQTMQAHGDAGRPLWNTEFGQDAGNIVTGYACPSSDPQQNAAFIDDKQREQWQLCLNHNASDKTYVKCTPFVLHGPNENATTCPLPPEIDDYGYGITRADRISKRPTYTWYESLAAANLDFNAAWRLNPYRVGEIHLEVPWGYVPSFHQYEWLVENHYLIVRDVAVDHLQPSIIPFEPT
jgi:hypothetical protein